MQVVLDVGYLRAFQLSAAEVEADMFTRQARLPHSESQLLFSDGSAFGYFGI